jgi:hypothetical protein
MASTTAKLAIGSAILAVAGVVALYAVSPWIAVHNMRAAAKSGDHRTLSDYIDYPALRESIRGQIATMMNASMDKPEMRDNPFAGLGRALATGLINQMVDSMVTPQALANAMTSGEFKARKGDAKLTAEDNERFNRMTTSGYESLDRFVVAVKRETDSVEFVLRRRGPFTWQLTEVGLPNMVPSERVASAPRPAANLVDTTATGLHRAIQRGNDDEAVDIVVARQIDVNAQDGGGNTALHLAAANGNLRVVQALVHAEARLDIKNTKGERASDVADPIVVHLLRK